MNLVFLLSPIEYAFRQSIKTGDLLDALNDNGVWQVCEVYRCTSSHVYVKWLVSNRRYGMGLHRGGGRIAPPFTKSRVGIHSNSHSNSPIPPPLPPARPLTPVDPRTIDPTLTETCILFAPIPPQIDCFMTNQQRRNGEMRVISQAKDNSCLFHAIAYLCDGQKGGTGREVMIQRLRVHRQVAADPLTYSSSILGSNRQVYLKNLLNPASWGGAIELGIFAQLYAVEIFAFDYSHPTVIRFGEGRSFKKRIFLCYNGSSHYDAIAFYDYQQERHQTYFAIADTKALKLAQLLVEELHVTKCKKHQEKGKIVWKGNGLFELGSVGKHIYQQLVSPRAEINKNNAHFPPPPPPPPLQVPPTPAQIWPVPQPIETRRYQQQQQQQREQHNSEQFDQLKAPSSAPRLVADSSSTRLLEIPSAFTFSPVNGTRASLSAPAASPLSLSHRSARRAAAAAAAASSSATSHSTQTEQAISPSFLAQLQAEMLQRQRGVPSSRAMPNARTSQSPFPQQSEIIDDQPKPDSDSTVTPNPIPYQTTPLIIRPFTQLQKETHSPAFYSQFQSLHLNSSRHRNTNDTPTTSTTSSTTTGTNHRRLYQPAPNVLTYPLSFSSKYWTCHQCTFHNSLNITACSICQAKRITGVGTAATTSTSTGTGTATGIGIPLHQSNFNS